MLIDTQSMTFTEDNFQATVLRSQSLVLVDCWASWCSSFRPNNPVYPDLAIAFAGQLKIGSLNIANAESLATRYSIRVVPTLLIFQHGYLVERIVGSLSHPDLTHKLNSLLVRQSSRGRVACL